jgi:YesN/AraC family two-component response regulator
MKTILIVDDETPTLEMLELFLGALGYAVLTANNQAEGFEIFEREKPPIILTDIKMPGQDGLTFLEQVKSLRPQTEVIVITGHGDRDLAQRAFDLKATEFLHKPLDTDVLEKVLENIETKMGSSA